MQETKRESQSQQLKSAPRYGNKDAWSLFPSVALTMFCMSRIQKDSLFTVYDTGRSVLLGYLWQSKVPKQFFMTWLKSVKHL